MQKHSDALILSRLRGREAQVKADTYETHTFGPKKHTSTHTHLPIYLGIFNLFSSSFALCFSFLSQFPLKPPLNHLLFYSATSSALGLAPEVREYVNAPACVCEWTMTQPHNPPNTHFKHISLRPYTATSPSASFKTGVRCTQR